MSKRNIKNHANYSESDYEYLKHKGYTDAEIRRMWDRQSEPCHHEKMPIDIVAYLNA